MSIEDAREHLLVVHARGALVVDDDIVTLRPVGPVVHRQRGVGGFIVRPDHIHLHIRAGLNAFAQDVLLVLVIMAASTGDEQGVERFGFGSRCFQTSVRGGSFHDTTPLSMA